MADDQDPNMARTPSAQMTVPIESIARLVISHLDAQRKATLRWTIGLLVAFLALVVGVVELYLSPAIDSRVANEIQEYERERNEMRIEERLGVLVDSQRFLTEARPAQLGRTEIVLGVNDVARYELQLGTPGRYRIEAIALERDLDPVLYLYRLRATRTAIDAITYNDDISDIDLNSRIETELDIVTGDGDSRPYYVEIEEFSGEPGRMELRVALVDESAENENP